MWLEEWDKGATQCPSSLLLDVFNEMNAVGMRGTDAVEHYMSYAIPAYERWRQGRRYKKVGIKPINRLIVH